MEVGKTTLGESPFVGCFAKNGSNFIYDVNTNEILKVEEPVFLGVVRAVNEPERASEFLDHPDITTLQKHGYLSSHRPNGTTAHCKDCLSKELASSVNQVTIEVTRDCNHRCLYCPFSPADQEKRSHSQESMDWETAQASIDYLLTHSSNQEYPTLGFYGGEPLLQWDLIERCIEYAIQQAGSIDLHLTMTTNATLMTRQIAEKLAKHKVSVMVSLDGDENDHNAFRILRGDRSGGHSATLAGLAHLRHAYGSLAGAKVRILGVVGPWSDYHRLEEFFETNPPPEVAGLNYKLTFVSHPDLEGLYSPPSMPSSVEDSQPTQLAVTSFGEMEQRWIQALAEGSLGDGQNIFVRQLFEKTPLTLHKRSKDLLGDMLGPRGICQPGVRKVFVQVTGDILLCERVHDNFVLGNIHDDGVQIENCISLLDEVIHAFDKRCADCVFCRLCSGCPASYTDADGSISENSISLFCEEQKRLWANHLPRYATALDQNPNCFDFMDAITIS